YGWRHLWQRSSHSSQMLRVTPGTRRRGTGSTIRTWEGVRDAGSQPRKLWEAGEPCALKGASTVRGGEVGKGLAEIPLDESSRSKQNTAPRWPPTPHKEDRKQPWVRRKTARFNFFGGKNGREEI